MKWVKFSDQKPSYRDMCLIWCKGGIRLAWFVDNWWVAAGGYFSDTIDLQDVLYWMSTKDFPALPGVDCGYDECKGMWSTHYIEETCGNCLSSKTGPCGYRFKDNPCDKHNNK